MPGVWQFKLVGQRQPTATTLHGKVKSTREQLLSEVGDCGNMLSSERKTQPTQWGLSPAALHQTKY